MCRRSEAVAGGPCSLPRDASIMIEEEEAKAISRLIERLVVRFPQFPAGTVEETVSSAHQAFEGARVRVFVPLLVEHDALMQLKELARQADLVARPGAGAPHPALRA
ncbi:MAG TPA: hypothetical protein VK204_10480 [Nocardioidaceae bacterium]|nr:hypothetical protein [Nocardioidaceae bacterium]